MKLNILSDLHLNMALLAAPKNDADVVILAGDIARPQEALRWAQSLAKPVLYVLGNHEFYGSTITGTAAEFKTLCAGTAVYLLDTDEIILAGVRFLGATLWTDFMLFGEGAKRAAAISQACRVMRDFDKIRTDDATHALFTPADSVALFRAHSQWLDAKLSEPFAGPTVVITHHAPSAKSIHPRFAESLINTCFVSDAEHLVRGNRAQLWVHGHTHDSFDYWLDGTRVICNPRGYAKSGINENARFDPNLVIKIT